MLYNSYITKLVNDSKILMYDISWIFVQITISIIWQFKYVIKFAHGK